MTTSPTPDTAPLFTYQNWLVRSWQPGDRPTAAAVIATSLAEYGLTWDPDGADQDVLQVESAYWARGGEFWVIERHGMVVGTAAYFPVSRGNNAVEIRKMYLAAPERGQGLGKVLLRELEAAIARRGYGQVWIETATVLAEAVRLYEQHGYQAATGVETSRCDRIYTKQLAAHPTPEVNPPAP
jgi:putative acetyltransferase